MGSFATKKIFFSQSEKQIKLAAIISNATNISIFTSTKMHAFKGKGLNS